MGILCVSLLFQLPNLARYQGSLVYPYGSNFCQIVHILLPPVNFVVIQLGSLFVEGKTAVTNCELYKRLICPLTAGPISSNLRETSTLLYFISLEKNVLQWREHMLTSL